MVRKQAGYSLLELMVAVAVMTVIATMSIPSYHQSIIRAQIGEAVEMAKPLTLDIEKYYRVHHRFPESNEVAGIPSPEKLIGNFVSQIALSDGALHISFGNHANKIIEGEVLSLRPLIVPDSPRSPISWGCGLRGSPKGMDAVGQNRTSLKREFLPFDCF